MAVPHEITLLVFTTNADGTKSVVDILETSKHFAPFFARRIARDPDATHIAAISPGAPWNTAKLRELKHTDHRGDK